MNSRVTEGRIRDVCMINPNANPNFQQFKLEKLVKDMNTTYGVSIKLQDNSGRRRAFGEVCGEIYDYIPDTSICVVKSNGKMPTVGDIARVAKSMNDKYGSSIVYYIDPMNPKSGYRPIDQICEQMQDVANAVRRRMEDDLDVVKNRLEEHIMKLKALENDFSNGFVNISSAMNRAINIDPTTGTAVTGFYVSNPDTIVDNLVKRHEEVLAHIDKIREKDKAALKLLNERAARKEISKPDIDIRLDIMNTTQIGAINNLFENLPIHISGNKEKDYENLVDFYIKIKRKAQLGDEHAVSIYKKHRDAFKILEAGFSPLNTTRAQIVNRAGKIALDSATLFG